MMGMALDFNSLAYEETGRDAAVYSPPELKILPAETKRTAYAFCKRCFDIVFAALASLILLPLFLLIAAAVKLDSKGPVIFVHNRVGRNNRTIRILKFRSMVDNAEEIRSRFTPEQKARFERNFKLDDDSRITRVGRFLRKTSLDELPQLINILLNDLSFVGPRPVVPDELERYGYKSGYLLSVKPGLTGYWQVGGRNATTYEERMEMELYYTRNCSLRLDLKILLKTVPAVLAGKGAK